MDTNNWRAAQGVHYTGQAIGGEPVAATGSDGGNWRSQLLPDSRQRIVNKLVKTLMKHLPFSGQEGLEELKKVAVRFEETMYTAATSQSDYLEKIALKMMTIEMESRNPMANCLQSNAASNRKNPPDPATQSIWSPIQNRLQRLAIPMISNESRGTILDVPGQNHNMQSIENWSTQSLLQQQSQSVLRQQLQQPMQQPSIMHQQQTSMPQHQMLTTQEQQKQQLSGQQPNTSNMQPMIGKQNSIQQQKSMIALQQQQTISQPNNLPSKHQQQSTTQQNILPSMHQQQTISQPNNLPSKHQQQSTTQQNILPSMHQQQLGFQTNLSGFQQQQIQLNITNMSPDQAQPRQSQPMQQQLMSQTQSQPGQLQQQIVLQQQVKASQRDMPQWVQTSNPLLQQQTTIDQQKRLLQSRKDILEVPINPLTQTENANGGDWQEVIYEKIKSMNEMYFPELNDMYQRMAAKLQQHDALPQQSKNEQLGKKLRFIKVMLKHLIIFLRTNKNEIQPAHMEKIVGVEKQIVNILSSNRPQESASSLLQGHLAQSHMHAMQQSQGELPQISQMQEFEKTIYGVSSLSNAGNSVHYPATTALMPNQSHAIGTLAMPALPLLADFSCADGTHGVASTIASGNSNVVGQPVERLLEVIKSMSPKALSASASDISSIVSMVDRIAGSAPGNGSRAATGEDLAATTKCRLQAMNFFTQDEPTGTKKKYTGDMPSNFVSPTGSSNDSFSHLNGNESNGESTGASSIKRPRIKANYALEEELQEINQKLIDTAVCISEDDVDPTAVAEGAEGTIVKCFFRAVALAPYLKSQYASAQMSPIQPLRLLIPDNYPNCSPILLDKFPVEVSKEYEDLSIKAKSRFSISLRTLEQPMSLGDIARTWDECARSVICEYAQSGGGTFSSEYGAWENCFSAA